MNFNNSNDSINQSKTNHHHRGYDSEEIHRILNISKKRIKVLIFLNYKEGIFFSILFKSEMWQSYRAECNEIQSNL